MGTVAIRAEIKKAIAEGETARIYGWAALSRDQDGAPIIDADGDWIPIEEIETAAQQALLDRGGRSAVGVNHEAYGLGDLVESFVTTEEKQRAFGLEGTPQGWMVGIRTTSPTVIEAVRSGELREISIRAEARRESLELPDGKSWTDILKRDGAPIADDSKVSIIRDLKLREIELLSIVDRGASGNATSRPGIVLITKRGPMNDEKKRSVGAILADMLDAGKFSGLAEDELEAITEAVAAMNAPPPAMDDVAMADDSAPADAPKADDGEPADKADDVAKSDGLAKRNVELEKRVAELEAAAAHSALCELVKRDYAYLPGASVDDLARLVHELRVNLGKRHADQLESVLKSASEAIKTGGLLDATAAHADHGSSDEAGQLREIAKSLREKNPQLSAASALLEAGRARPDLWEAHRKAR